MQEYFSSEHFSQIFYIHFLEDLNHLANKYKVSADDT